MLNSNTKAKCIKNVKNVTNIANSMNIANGMNITNGTNITNVINGEKPESDNAKVRRMESKQKGNMTIATIELVKCAVDTECTMPSQK